MSFKKLRGVNLPEEKQGLIRYTCLTVAEQPRHIQKKIRRLCDDAGGPYSAALWDMMCTRDNVAAISQRHHVSESILYQARKEFYEGW
ncbi:MAG: hypothetical protein MJ074_06675 [Oscillospiraceae bacterium]|nr:hypothetical protein [Oscillospiraceae bacterium]